MPWALTMESWTENSARLVSHLTGRGLGPGRNIEAGFRVRPFFVVRVLENGSLSGATHGRYKHGLRTKETMELLREMHALLQASKAMITDLPKQMARMRQP